MSTEIDLGNNLSLITNDDGNYLRFKSNQSEALLNLDIATRGFITPQIIQNWILDRKDEAKQ